MHCYTSMTKRSNCLAGSMSRVKNVTYVHIIFPHSIAIIWRGRHSFSEWILQLGGTSGDILEENMEHNLCHIMDLC